jgi:hypothetical protein
VVTGAARETGSSRIPVFSEYPKKGKKVGDAADEDYGGNEYEAQARRHEGECPEIPPQIGAIHSFTS